MQKNIIRAFGLTLALSLAASSRINADIESQAEFEAHICKILNTSEMNKLQKIEALKILVQEALTADNFEGLNQIGRALAYLNRPIKPVKPIEPSSNEWPNIPFGD